VYAIFRNHLGAFDVFKERIESWVHLHKGP
jgi:hypothetical protein